MSYQYTFDCRTIVNGCCTKLKPWNKMDEGMVSVYTCKATNNIIFPLLENGGKVNQKVIQVEPLFECPHMHKLRKSGIAMPVQAIVTEEGKTIQWNRTPNQTGA